MTYRGDIKSMAGHRLGPKEAWITDLGYRRELRWRLSSDIAHVYMDGVPEGVVSRKEVVEWGWKRILQSNKHRGDTKQ